MGGPEKRGPNAIALGTRVRITAGLANGVTGIVTDVWIPVQNRERTRQWVVRSADLVRLRVVREDYLEPVEVP